MYKRILVAYDGSEAGQKAILYCKDLTHLDETEVFLIAVRPPPAALIGGESGIYDPELEKEEERRYQTVLEDGLKRLSDAGHAAQGKLLVGDAVSEIARHAAELNADLIVVGHKHLNSWAARWWRGSVSKVLIEHAPCSVLVVITR